jgi:hypothetical protein
VIRESVHIELGLSGGPWHAAEQLLSWQIVNGLEASPHHPGGLSGM